MKYKFDKKYVVFAVIIILNVIFIYGVRQWRLTRSNSVFDVEQGYRQKYPGATGVTISAFDKRTEKWLNKLDAESVETSLSGLADMTEYMMPGVMGVHPTLFSISEQVSRETLYESELNAILGNRRFRKCLGDLSTIPNKDASRMLSDILGGYFSSYKSLSQDEMRHIEKNPDESPTTVLSTLLMDDDGNFYPAPDAPPTKTGYRNAVFSCLLLASQLELSDLNQAIREIAVYASEEFEFFQLLEEKNSPAAASFLQSSLYNPSILLAGVLCDPNTAEKLQPFNDRVVKQELVDYRARSTEYDRHGYEGDIPVEPFSKMLTIRTYHKIKDDEIAHVIAE